MSTKETSRYESPCAKFIYNPEEGDYKRNIPPGTPFEDLPDDWCCPESAPKKSSLKSWTTERPPSAKHRLLSFEIR